MFQIETLRRKDGGLQCFQWNTTEREWKPPMFPVETPKRKYEGLQYFQWRHKGERMKDSNVSSGDTEEIGRRTSMFPVETLGR